MTTNANTRPSEYVPSEVEVEAAAKSLAADEFRKADWNDIVMARHALVAARTATPTPPTDMVPAAALADAEAEVERLTEAVARRADQRDEVREQLADRDRVIAAVRELAERFDLRRENASQAERHWRTMLARDITPTRDRLAWGQAADELRAALDQEATR